MKRAPGAIEDCLQNEPAFCRVACPFHLDVRDFIEKMQRGGFNAAYRTYLNAVGFPAIVTALCPEPCQGACPRRLSGGAISMKLLEQAATTYARNTDPVRYNVPAKQKKVAIIGAGPSGLACALRLAERKYDVTVFEKSGRLGGHLHQVLPPEIFLSDIERQFDREKVELTLNTEIGSLTGLDFAAIYVATGANGTDFGLAQEKGGAFASTRPGVFLGGSLRGKDSMQAIAAGLRVSGAMERFIKAGGMNHPDEMTGTRLELGASLVASADTVRPSNGEAYTRDEAVLEAGRCLQCSCDACVRFCDLMRYFKKFPRRIAEEVEITIHPGTLDGNGTVATRLISSCNHCGLCQQVCPQRIDTGGLLLAAHRTMREKGAMPWAFHDFFLRDMASANGEASLARRPTGHETSRYLFFPGCQLGASDPRYVTESYRFLLEHWPDTALMLCCCGAPAEWAGDEAVRAQAMARLRQDWSDFGKPKAVFACPSCRQILGRHLPEIEGVFLYDLILQQGITQPLGAPGTTASVFDPCASREEPGVQQAVRALAEKAGFELAPLPLEGKLAQCCSFGGQVAVAHPPYAHRVVATRIAEGGHPYISYCSNCRDIFARAGKPCWHILDIQLGLNGPDRAPPTLTERRINRLVLKRRVLEEFWKEVGEMGKPRMDLIVSAELGQKLSDEWILETEIATVIEACEKSGRRILDPATGSFFGHHQIDHMTYWVEYAPRSDGSFELRNAYGHRMRIEER